MPTPSQPKLLARNVAAVRRFADPSTSTRNEAGNPVSTRLESGVGNCFPGLECDLRNLERRFFPFLEVDIISDIIVIASVDRDGVNEARAAGIISQADADVYEAVVDALQSNQLVVISRLSGTFGVLGNLAFNLSIPQIDGEPGVPGDLDENGVSTGPGRLPSDAWTAIRLLTEGTDVTITLKRIGIAALLQLTAKRARYLDDNGALSAAFLPGELTQSLCSPWTHDFRDCGCFYWASNHPDIVQPVLPPSPSAPQPWNGAVDWQRRSREINTTPPPLATEMPGQQLRHYEINNRWQELHFVVGRREITAPFAPNAAQGAPLADLAQLLAHLRYAAGVELAVTHEYLAAAYSLKASDTPGLSNELRNDIRATRSELMRIAIGEMRHLRAVNDVIRGLTPPDAFEPALRVATQVPDGPGQFRLVQPRAATRAAIVDFINIEAPSAGVDGLYVGIVATLESPPADVAPLVTDEWRQAIRSVIAEGEDHYQTFLDIREWLSNHQEVDYLRGMNMQVALPGDAANDALQMAYRGVLESLYTGYKKGRFAGANEINQGRNAMVAPGGIDSRAFAVAQQGFLVAFGPLNDPRFEPLDPPAP